jgi:hypothetical protein
MVHWAIRQIDPKLNDDTAFQIASRGGSGDAQIDAIWEHSDGQRLCIAQVKFSDILLEQNVENYTDTDGEEELRVEKFDGEAVVDLQRALDKILDRPPHPSERLQRAIQLYEEARRSRKNIDFFPIVFGDRKTSFDTEVRSFINRFNSDRITFSKHNVIPLDLSGLNEMMDRNFEKPIGVAQIPTSDWAFGPERTHSGLFIALVPAHALTDLREKYNIAIYHSNFRFMLGHTSVWRGMMSTLQDDQEKKLFHLYHNGITILGKDISADPGQLKIHGLQVVNGLQTIETLYDFARSRPGDNGPRVALSDAYVFVRFIDLNAQPTPGPDARALDEKIAEYSNKQNPILNRDLRSNDAVQKRLQHEIDCLGYKYERKRGQYGRRTHNLASNEKLAQYALSFWLKSPAEAKNKKKLLFVKDNENPQGFYDKIFFPNVPAAALLIPYEIYDRRIIEQNNSFRRSVTEHGDFILLAMFAEIFMARYRLNLSRTPIQKNREFLERFHRELRDGNIDRELKIICRELILRLVRVTKKEIDQRRREALEQDRSEPSVRNILFNYSYNSHKRELMPNSVISRLSRKLPRI